MVHTQDQASVEIYQSRAVAPACSKWATARNEGAGRLEAPAVSPRHFTSYRTLLPSAYVSPCLPPRVYILLVFNVWCELQRSDLKER